MTAARYRAPWWLPGGHAQTIWPAIASRRPPLPPEAMSRERWSTPDGDFVDVDFLAASAAADAPLLVLFHGLEGSSSSHYALSFAALAQRFGRFLRFQVEAAERGPDVFGERGRQWHGFSLLTQ